MSLVGLVTLDNESGTDYRNAHLQLIAGSLHQVPANHALKTIAVVATRTYDSYTVGATAEQAFQYHLYTIHRPSTLLNKQKKQIGLLSAHGIPVTTSFELHGANSYQTDYSALGAAMRVPVETYLSFENKGGDLGIPLPAGSIRVYEDDSRGLAQYIGGDRIDHTPKNQTIRLYLGDAFDLVANQKQTDFHLISKCESSGSYEVDIANAKDTAENVTVIEPIPGDWTIVKESAPHRKSSSGTATWKLTVPANGSTSLTYSARARWCVRS